MQITDELPPSSPIGLDLVVTDFFLFFTVIGIIIYFLHRQSLSKKDLDISSMKPNLTVLIASLLLVAIFAPSNLNLYPEMSSDSFTRLIGMSWDIVGLSFGSIMFSFIIFIVALPFMFLRLVFVYQIYKYYLGTTTRKRVVIAGILGEIQFALISIAIIPFGLSSEFIAVIISIPIPILLLVGLAILHFVPQSNRISEWTELEDKDWWDKEKEETNKSGNE